eukprot:COSAG02_NODE_1373_length_13014_cov_5.725358_1_plen_255_part_00
MKLKRLARTISAQQRARTAAEQAELRALQHSIDRLAEEDQLVSVRAAVHHGHGGAPRPWICISARVPVTSCRRDSLYRAKQNLALALSAVSARSELCNIGCDVFFEVVRALQATSVPLENWAGFDDRGTSKPSWPALVVKIERADSIGTRLLNRWDARRLNDCSEVVTMYNQVLAKLPQLPAAAEGRGDLAWRAQVATQLRQKIDIIERIIKRKGRAELAESTEGAERAKRSECAWSLLVCAYFDRTIWRRIAQ